MSSIMGHIPVCAHPMNFPQCILIIYYSFYQFTWNFKYFFIGAMANKPSRIVGGESARIEDWPAVVVVRNILTNETCGGVLISHKHVLTVAHCIVSGREEDDPSMDQLEYYKVRSGSSSCKNMDQDKWIPVVTINIHRFFLKYPPTPDADIAILEVIEILYTSSEGAAR